MEIIYAGDAFAELYRLPLPERKAMANAIEKLRMPGGQLGFPHTSQVQGTRLRELRPDEEGLRGERCINVWAIPW